MLDFAMSEGKVLKRATLLHVTHNFRLEEQCRLCAAIAWGGLTPFMRMPASALEYE